eukprot:CAMPEP_0174233756 /NCGR_PEP_ID=MMETSP0417-20130205/3712_1 /TAXON_ID=242541 /ORGANISM="Mayorella sp, Strain BSH-02190019" /LENGTH=695 /DNA_ID=CAMNT_0015312021 /DNA_START=19 /DNA_END=2106 /DNA_ORIENTATION=-
MAATTSEAETRGLLEKARALFRQPRTSGLRVLPRTADEEALARRAWRLLAEQMRLAKQGTSVSTTVSTSLDKDKASSSSSSSSSDTTNTLNDPTSSTSQSIAPVVFWGMASELMQLKYLDPENDEVVGRKVIKLRWQFRHCPTAREQHDREQRRGRVSGPLPNSTEGAAPAPTVDDAPQRKMRSPDVTFEQARLQLPFVDRTTLSVERDVLPAIFAHTHSKKMYANDLGDGSFLRLEYRRPAPRHSPLYGEMQWVACVENDHVSIPLVFPGPVLPDESCIEFRFVFQGPHSEYFIPPQYRSLPRLPLLIDAGANPWDTNLGDRIRRAAHYGVIQSLFLSTTVEESADMIKLCHRFPNSVFCSVGVHPVAACSTDARKLQLLFPLLKKNPDTVVAVGECGLDEERAPQWAANWNEAHPDAAEPLTAEKLLDMQEELWVSQLHTAAANNLPVILHIRGAHERALRVLEEHAPRLKRGGVINCFSGTVTEMKTYIRLGFHIGITGLVCHDKRADNLLEALKSLPLDRLILSTDCPHLVPKTMPRPHPKQCEMGFLPYVLVKVAEEMGLGVLEVADAATENTRRLFALPRILSRPGQPGSGSLVSAHLLHDLLHPAKVTSAEDTQPPPPTPATAAAAGDATRVQVPTSASVNADDDPTTFVYQGVSHKVTPEKKLLLVKQQTLLPEAAFAELLQDLLRI